VERKIFVIIPTYNEVENIGNLLEEIMNLKADIEIVVVDDNSPDGTGVAVKKLSRKLYNIHLLVRRKPREEGFARVDGYKFALEMGADFIIEMDADFSHKPKYITDFLKQIKDFDLVIGSRYVKGGGEKGRKRFRVFLSSLANFYIRCVYGIKEVFDCSSGFRCFRRETLTKINLEELKAKGPAILPEILYRLKDKGVKIKEIPIMYEARKRGKSKFSFAKITESLLLPLFLRLNIFK